MPPRLLAAALLVTLAGCDHTAPFSYAAPPAQGPFSEGFPRRLTFSTGDDRTPSVRGATVAFSRRLAERRDADRCLEFLPVAGGTLTGTACPGGATAGSDTLVDTWLLPALSPGEDRVAYVRASGLIINVVPASRQLVVAPVRAPGNATVALETPYRLADGRVANQFAAIEWASATTLRFIAGFEIVNSLVRPADTIFSGLAVAELDLATGDLATVPGTDDAIAYADAPGGGLWFVRRGETVVRRASGGGSTVVADFGRIVRAVASADGIAVAIVEFAGEGGPVPVVMAADPGGGVPRTLWNGLYPLRLAGVPGRPWVVAEIHRGPRPTRFGGGASLWLLDVR